MDRSGDGGNRASLIAPAAGRLLGELQRPEGCLLYTSNEAIKNAESKKKEILLESKEEVLKNKAEADREIKERRDEVKRQEKRILQKEETLCLLYTSRCV